MGEVADIGHGFAGRLDVEDGVADGVSGRADCRDAGQEFLAVLDEHDAVAHRQQVLLGLRQEGLQRPTRQLLVGPEFEVGLLDVELRVREIALAVVADMPPRWSI